MTHDRLKAITLRVFFGDMLLNWALGVFLMFLPDFARSAIGAEPLPLGGWRILGTLFVLFAIWQTWIVRGWNIGPDGLWFACWMAWIPVILLTMALLYSNLPLREGARAVLWVGDIYMWLLGSWYAFVARRLARADSRPQ